ncbi:MAG: hypothetical protein HYX41_05090 [Bdellovibrio sp.]|nr:hypothetical protein [Bdellovibrio sp.]
MNGRSREDLYLDFIEFVEQDSQRERHQMNRRMAGVFFWCFLLPAVFSASILSLAKMKIIPIYVRNQLDWSVLLFPVLYSLYVLWNEVVPHFPKVRKGGLVRTLAYATKEGKWRERVSIEMAKSINGSEEEWRWIILSFKMDLEALEYRNRYLTALAGAVFFLLMQGIDSLMDSGSSQVLVEMQGHIARRSESSFSDITQFVGLGLFLALLYLSGNQTYHSLLRYLNCAQLNLVQVDRRRAH